jgi:hypothetical protein
MSMLEDGGGTPTAEVDNDRDSLRGAGALTRPG